VPALNEEVHLGDTLPAIEGFLSRAGGESEIVVVDDGSTDRTAEVVREFASGSRVPTRLVRHAERRGKGRAVQTGVHEARGETVFFTDADLPYDLEFVTAALPRLRSRDADVVVGGRDLPGSRSDRAFPWMRRCMGKSYAVLVRWLLGLGFGDTQCGIKGFRGPVAKELFSVLTIAGFGFDAEILFVARSWGLRIERLPVRLHHRGESKVRLVEDSARMFGDLFRIRRNARLRRYPRMGRALDRAATLHGEGARGASDAEGTR